MHGRIVPADGASLARPCEDCPLSPECPAGAAGGHSIEVTVRVLRRGDRIFRSGEPFDSLYMVRSGMVKTCTPGESGDEPVLGFHVPGDLIGMDAIHGGRHASGAAALDTSSVCRLPYGPLCRQSARTPRAQRRLLSKMSQRIRDDERRLAMLAQRSAGRRMASFLVSLADARHAHGLRIDEIPLPTPRADIASYLMLAVETVSRALTRLQGSGVIDVRRHHVRILDADALRAIAGGAKPKTAPAGVRQCSARDRARP